MMKRFQFKKLFLFTSAVGMIGVSHPSMAAAFYLWEQDAASIGNYHAGIVSTADDASTAWYNPAGLVRIKNQELIAGADPVMTDFRFKGTVGVSSIFDPESGLPAPPTGLTAQGGGFNVVPFGHYVAPLSKCVVLGLSVVVPFGLKTDYGYDTFARYAAVLSKIRVIDYTPSLGFAINDKLSVGVGFDIQHLNAEFIQVATMGILGSDLLDTQSKNSACDTAYGYRVGALYQFTPCTRIGLNYRSKVTHHASGNSVFSGPLAPDEVSQYSDTFKATTTLPAVTTLGVFHSLNPCWDIMGSVSYTQWNVFKDLILQHVAGTSTINSLVITIPERYHNVWNYAVGLNYHPCAQWIFRTGIGYDQSPANDAYRNLQLPDSDRIAVGLGGHYQMTQVVGFDLGWTHIFAMNTRLNVAQAIDTSIVTTNGSVRSSADVFGLQIKWDFI